MHLYRSQCTVPSSYSLYAFHLPESSASHVPSIALSQHSFHLGITLLRSIRALSLISDHSVTPNPLHNNRAGHSALSTQTLILHMHALKRSCVGCLPASLDFFPHKLPLICSLDDLILTHNIAFIHAPILQISPQSKTHRAPVHHHATYTA